MNRNTFLGTLIALPVGLFLVRCSSSNNSGTGGPAAPPTRSGTQTIYTSNDSGSPIHHHTFAIDDAVIAAPPSAGLSGETAADSTAHTHTVTVSMADLTQIAAGQSVMVTTSNTQGHAHAFTFMKIA